MHILVPVSRSCTEGDQILGLIADRRRSESVLESALVPCRERDRTGTATPEIDKRTTGEVHCGLLGIGNSNRKGDNHGR